MLHNVEERPGGDPLARAAKILGAHGWTVSRRPLRVYSVPEMQRERLRHLDDFEQQRFRFARYQDQILDLERDGQCFACFGESRFGPLLTDAAGAVWVLVLSPDGFGDEAAGKLRPVNSSLDAFVASYCTFVSMLFDLRRRCLALADTDVAAAAAAFESQLVERLVPIDEAVSEPESMWNALGYGIGDGLFFFSAAAHDFVADERFSFYGATSTPGPPENRATR